MNEQAAIKARRALTAWYEEKGISLADTLSLAFVPLSTFSEIFRKPRLGPQHRLYLLTGLEELKLTEGEMARYKDSLSQKKDDYLYEKVATYFIGQWSDQKGMPSMKYRLVPSSRTRFPIEDMAKKIKTELLWEEFQNEAPNKAAPAILAAESKVAGVVMQLEQLGSSLHKLIEEGTEEEFKLLIKQSSKSLNFVYGKLVVLTNEKPWLAAQAFRKYKTNFSQKTPG